MGRTLLAVFVLLLLIGVTAAEVETSDRCGSCHRDIYRMWRDSSHAEASEDPFFAEVLREIEESRSPDLTKLCLECHAPMAVLTGDIEMKQSSSRDGVSCDYCHSLVEVEITKTGARPRLELGDVKRGTIAEAESPAHKVAYSELHRTARICAPCHEFASAAGLPVLTTYSEWAASSAAARGETCQGCHMSLTEGKVVDPRVQRDSAARVNLHEMPGGHSLQQLYKALDIKIHPKRSGDELKVTVTISNEGAGHAVPTGMPGRRIVMVVEAIAGDGGSYREERVYAKNFTDADGRPVRHVADFFTKPLELEADTRIGADETRTEVFGFPVPPTTSVSVTVKLHYEHAPRGPESERVWVTFFSERRFLKRAG